MGLWAGTHSAKPGDAELAGEREEIVETTRAFVVALLDVRLGLLVGGWLGNGTASARMVVAQLGLGLSFASRHRERNVITRPASSRDAWGAAVNHAATTTNAMV